MPPIPRSTRDHPAYQHVIRSAVREQLGELEKAIGITGESTSEQIPQKDTRG